MSGLGARSSGRTRAAKRGFLGDRSVAKEVSDVWRSVSLSIDDRNRAELLSRQLTGKGCGCRPAFSGGGAPSVLVRGQQDLTRRCIAVMCQRLLEEWASRDLPGAAAPMLFPRRSRCRLSPEVIGPIAIAPGGRAYHLLAAGRGDQRPNVIAECGRAIGGGSRALGRRDSPPEPILTMSRRANHGQMPRRGHDECT